jgi:hypothetical protein
VQDKISNALVAHHPEACSINPFTVLNGLEAGLTHHTLISNDQLCTKYGELSGVVKEEYENIVKNEVQRAIAATGRRVEKPGISRIWGDPEGHGSAQMQRIVGNTNARLCPLSEERLHVSKDRRIRQQRRCRTLGAAAPQ